MKTCVSQYNERQCHFVLVNKLHCHTPQLQISCKHICIKKAAIAWHVPWYIPCKRVQSQPQEYNKTLNLIRHSPKKVLTFPTLYVVADLNIPRGIEEYNTQQLLAKPEKIRYEKPIIRSYKKPFFADFLKELISWAHDQYIH